MTSTNDHLRNESFRLNSSLLPRLRIPYGPYYDQPAPSTAIVFDARHDLRSRDVASDAGANDMPDVLAEHQFRRGAGIGAGKHRGEWRHRD